jgi:hypothetical protein
VEGHILAFFHGLVSQRVLDGDVIGRFGVAGIGLALHFFELLRVHF